MTKGHKQGDEDNADDYDKTQFLCTVNGHSILHLPIPARSVTLGLSISISKCNEISTKRTTSDQLTDGRTDEQTYRPTYLHLFLMFDDPDLCVNVN